MLHRSFKSAKCKTSLKLASARLKLLKNKKDVQVKQLRRELAQLLESGQEQTARIRVENVIREVKMVAAYDLLEIYCELIAARFQIIESQKNCPIDMKEAITSVIFAAPRCSDVTELGDVRKQFTAKYGKEFVSAAVELRPDCGVSRMLIEKLSANATDLQAKLKFLKEIADEHSVKWEPVLLEQNELKPSHDLLDGPNTFVKAKIQVDPSPPPPPVQITTPPTFQPPQNHYSMNFANNTNERFSHEHDNTSFKRPYSPSMKNQNMEFENAAAAAMAAAESADIACRAAREAAEFASQGKFSRQPSTESHKSRLSDHSRYQEERRKDDRDTGNHSFQRRNSQLKDDNVNHSEQKPTRSDSLKTKVSSTIDDNAERYSPKNSFFSEQSSRQPWTESYKSRFSDHSRSEEERRKDDRDSGNHSFQHRNSQLEDDNGNHSEQKPIRSDSLKSKASSSIDDNAERYSPKNSFFSEQSSRQPSTESHKSRFNDHSLYEEEGRKDDRDSGNHSFQRRNSQLKDDNGQKPIRSDSLKSKSSSIDDNAERYSPKNHFFSEQSSSSHGRQSDSEERLTRKISSHKTSAVFDDSGSDVDDNHEFDTGRKNDSPKLKPQTSSSSSSSSDDDMPVSFDDSEGHNSSEDDETDKYKSRFDDHKPSKFDPPSIRRDSNIPNLNLENLRGGFKHQKSRIPPYTSPTTQINNKKPRDVSDSDNDGGSDAAVILPSPSINNNKRESSSFKQVNPPTRLQPKTTYFDSSDESETELESRASSSSSSSVISRRTKPTSNNPKPTDYFRQTSEVSPQLPKQYVGKEQLKVSSLSSSSGGSSVYNNSEISLKNSLSSTSHVHPKLPDCDDIAARFQALRVNRR